MASIELFITGGTISKVYNELNGELFCDEKHIPDMLLQARVEVDIKVRTLMLKDSLEMDDKDRQKIYQACKDSTSSKIIITHGTDTIVDTAQKLSTIKDKTIVLTGAMIPYAFKNSDALFNLGVAFGVGDKGTYICMNGQVFSWDSVKKNRQKGMFEAK